MTPNSFAGELSADRFTVKKILDLARAGSLRIPPFQRPMRWRRSDHRLLLDSLYHRYPVGTLLLWQRKAPPSTVVFGGFSVSAGDMGNAYWIVDGQQRIASIAGCLLRPDSSLPRKSNDFSFLFDLDAEKFIDATGQSAPNLIPVNQLHDPVQTAIWARSNVVSDDLHRKAQEAGSRLLGYEIPTYVTTADSDEVLRTIFARANTAGRQMREVEVFEALNKGLDPDKSPAGLLERLQRTLYALDFGKVDSDDLRKALIFLAGHHPKALPEALQGPGAADEWEGRTAEALRLTVEFLRDDAGIPHAQMLPYSLPLIILPRFFHRFPNPRERSVELLVRWVWRGIARESHMATNQNFNPLHRAFKGDGEEGVVQAFLGQVGRSRPAEMPVSKFHNLRGMRTRLEMAVLFHRAPRHLISQQPLSAMEIFDEADPQQAGLFESQQILPKERNRDRRGHLPTVSVHDKALRRSAHFLHPELGRGQDFARLLCRGSGEVMTSHAIPPHVHSAARSLDWDRVVAARQEVIRADVERTVDRLARWQEDGDGPSIEALIAEDGDDPLASR